MFSGCSLYQPEMRVNFKKKYVRASTTIISVSIKKYKYNGSNWYCNNEMIARYSDHNRILMDSAAYISLLNEGEGEELELDIVPYGKKLVLDDLEKVKFRQFTPKMELEFEYSDEELSFDQIFEEGYCYEIDIKSAGIHMSHDPAPWSEHYRLFLLPKGELYDIFFISKKKTRIPGDRIKYL